MLRKTMLDDCKSERLDEVLSVFSTVVLKKVVQHYEAPTTIAHQLAMENFSYTGERTALSALILAHKSSLTRTLAVKNEISAGYDDFAGLLNLKERQITRRHEQLKVAMEGRDQEVTLSDRDVKDIQHRAQKIWTGTDEWLETILHGDNRLRKDGVLGSSFTRVWGNVELGNLGEIEDQNRRGLLEELETRVREQNQRLMKWQEFEKSLTRHIKLNPKTEQSTIECPKGIDLGFESHQSLQISRDPLIPNGDNTWDPLEDYSRLMENMQNKLIAIGKPRERNSYGNQGPGSIRQQRKSEDAAFKTPKDRTAYDLDEISSDSESNDPSPSFEKYALKSTSQTPPSAYTEGPEDNGIEPLQKVDMESAPRPIHRISTPVRSTILRPSTPPGHADSPVASEILASVLTTSPSPTKPRHVLSLAERTRLSMSRPISKAHANLSDSDDHPELNELTQKLRRVSRLPPAGDQSVAAPSNHHEDLVSRTRQSMSGMAAVEKKAGVNRRRSIKAAERNKRDSRASYFPKHLETTVEDESILDDGVDKKKLIEGEADADYEAVFKTRPKIKTSPVSSPVKAWGDMGGQGTFGSSSPPIGGY